MRITDLLDDYYDTSVSIPEADAPSAERTKELSLKKLNTADKRRRKIPVGYLLAAVIALSLITTAVAVSYTMRDAARKDLGLAAGEHIPEYTEYTEQPGSVTEKLTLDEPKGSCTPVEGASVELVSTLCSGTEITAYLSVSPVTAEMAEQTQEENETLDAFACWDFGIKRPENMGGYSSGSRQIEYDPETQTALVCLSFHGEDSAMPSSLTMDIRWFHQDGEDYEEKYYGQVTIPITESEAIEFAAEITFENDFLPGETAALNTVSVGASYVTFTCQSKLFETLCQEYGDTAWFQIGDAYWGYYDELNGEARSTDPDEYTEMDAMVAYGRSWSASLNSLLETASLHLRDGTEISLSGLQLIDIGSPSETSVWTARFELPSVVDLTQIDHLTINGAEVPLS